MSTSLRGRSWASYFFLASIGLGIAWFAIQAWTGLQETDPARLRINRVPLGALVIIGVEILLLVLYLKAGELVGMVRVIAGIMGVVQILQSVVVALIAHYAEDLPFPEPSHVVTWVLAAANVLYALFGEGSGGEG